MRLHLFLVVAFISMYSLSSCKKWHDPKGYTDPQLTNPYCNDPQAVNYNWGFPGKPDSTVCFYPTQYFKGKVIFYDSILLSDQTFSFAKTDTLYMYPLSKTKLAIVGFCSAGDTLHFTVDNTLHANIDTTTAYGYGAQFCRVQDTVTGYVAKDIVDSTLYHVNFTVNADTGITYQTGSAIISQ